MNQKNQSKEIEKRGYSPNKNSGEKPKPPVIEKPKNK